MADELQDLPEISKPDIDRCINKGIYDKTFSSAACIASVGDRVFHRAAYGSPTQPPPMRRIGLDTLFDLASLTKPLASGLAALWLAGRTRIDLGVPLSKTIPEFRDSRFDDVTIDMLLDHTAGFPATRRYYDELADHDAKVASIEAWMGKPEAVQFIKRRVAETPFEYDPGTKTVYSDLGFLALGWIIEGIVGKPLNLFLERELYRPLGLSDDLFFIPLEDQRFRGRLRRRVFAATEQCSRRDRLLQGEVHDPTAWALGGIAGHAGLFGTVDAVWKLARTLWACYRGFDHTFLSGTVRRFWTRSKRVRNTTRALAWDTPHAHQSAAGKRFSRNSVGHLGFTGCSVWIDLSTDCIGVVLTNSAHPTPDGKEDAMQRFRPRVYELIAKEAEVLGPDPRKGTGAAAFSDTVGAAGTTLPLHNPLKGPGR